MENKCQAKVVIIGESSVGKSSIIIRLIRNSYSNDVESTVGESLFTKIISINGNEIQLNIWDTAGQEKFNAILPSTFRNASVVILVFSHDVSESVSKAKHYFNMAKDIIGSECKFYVVANKSDQKKDDDFYDISEGEDWAKEIGAKFYEVSAKNGDNIGALFNDIAISAVPSIIPPPPPSPHGNCCR